MSCEQKGGLRSASSSRHSHSTRTFSKDANNPNSLGWKKGKKWCLNRLYSIQSRPRQVYCSTNWVCSKKRKGRCEQEAPTPIYFDSTASFSQTGKVAFGKRHRSVCHIPAFHFLTSFFLLLVCNICNVTVIDPMIFRVSESSPSSILRFPATQRPQGFALRIPLAFCCPMTISHSLVRHEAYLRKEGRFLARDC